VSLSVAIAIINFIVALIYLYHATTGAFKSGRAPGMAQSLQAFLGITFMCIGVLWLVTAEYSPF